ncbi:hypothetical protein E2C01_096871 [Portunus trituberculatus]|uniref:BESS domain-containing protein n=1 Tax=Portunus trituberculatus TaxID=210409 RepID=A0A5B7K8F8_PORTR|nr:hypothetical protein [Portunus trituberculatus]
MYISGKQLQRRWKSLRECFRRELKLQQGSSGDGATKKRKYIYFDQLLFLTSTLTDRDTSFNYVAAQYEQDEEHEEGYTSSNSASADVPKRSNEQRKSKEYPQKNYEEDLINILIEKTKEDCDEDKAFLMSLLPKFRKFNDEQRFEAQMEIMKVMRRVQLMSTQGPSTSDHGDVPATSTF